ncbi:MAG: hypothetical protein LC105_07400 [Chitinophagales bacterium]|nr:hypothetical protein [Chitinophagales bacterium]
MINPNNIIEFKNFGGMSEDMEIKNKRTVISKTRYNTLTKDIFLYSIKGIQININDKYVKGVFSNENFIEFRKDGYVSCHEFSK